MRRYMLAVFVAFAVPISVARAQTDDRTAVLTVVHKLFDAMRAGDSAAARPLFAPGAQMARAVFQNGHFAARVDSTGPTRFINGMGVHKDYVADERTKNEVVHIDGPLAVVWADYGFYRGKDLNHCGVDAFEMAKTDDGWKIVSLIDSSHPAAECAGSWPAR